MAGFARVLGLEAQHEFDASPTRESIDLPFLPFSNFQRVLRAIGAAIGRDVRGMSRVAGSDRMRRARAASWSACSLRDLDQSRLRGFAASRARVRVARGPVVAASRAFASRHYVLCMDSHNVLSVHRRYSLAREML